jgi:hypothetical protein
LEMAKEEEMRKTDRPFRLISPQFQENLKNRSNHVSYVLRYSHEKGNKGNVVTEIRKNYLELYFLGHAVRVTETSPDGRYRLVGPKEFNPKDYLKSKTLKRMIRQCGDAGDWQVFFDDMRTYADFKKIMQEIRAKIVQHRKGKISEGVSETKHLADNMDLSRNEILIIDRQVAFPGKQKEGRIDLLGLRRLENGKYTFAVIELKNKYNAEMAEVFTKQLVPYIKLLFGKYRQFAKTYREVIRQKLNLGLLKGGEPKVADINEITRKDIMGIAVLDNFDIRSDLKSKALWQKTLENWPEDESGYCLKLYLKTNVLDSTFLQDHDDTVALLSKYRNRGGRR